MDVTVRYSRLCAALVGSKIAVCDEVGDGLRTSARLRHPAESGNSPCKRTADHQAELRSNACDDKRFRGENAHDPKRMARQPSDARVLRDSLIDDG